MNLQLALIILGIVVVLGIYLFSRWQEKQKRHGNRRNRQPGAKGVVAGALNSGRDEPSFDHHPVDQTEKKVYQHTDPGVDQNGDQPAVDLVDADMAGATASTTQSGEHVESEEASSPSVQYEADFDDEVHADTQDAINIVTVDPDVESAEEEVPVLDSRVDEASVPADDMVYFDSEAYVDQSHSGFESGGDTGRIDNALRGNDAGNGNVIAQGIEQTSEEPPVLNDSVPSGEPAAGMESQFEVDPHVADSAQVPGLESDQEALDADDAYQTDPSTADYAPRNEQLEAARDDEHIDVKGDQDFAEEDAEASVDDEDHSALRPSLSKFIGSIGPIHKLKQNIQQKLDTVKAERTMSAHGGTSDLFVRHDAPKLGEHRLQSTKTPERSPTTGQFSADALDRINPPELSTAAMEEEPMVEISPQDTFSGSAASINQTKGEPRMTQSTPASANGTIQPAEGFDRLSQIDYYVKLSGERDVSRDSVLAIYREGAAGIARHHSIYGLRLPEKVWRDLEQEPEEARFGDLVVTIQLVDHDGLVTENDMTRFSSLIMKLSESTGRGFAFMAPIENAHRQAQAIEQFKRQFDSIFVVNIKPLEEEMFEGAIIERCAGQIGLTPDSNNFYARYKPVGKQKVCLYSLANMSDTGEFDLENMRAVRTRGVTFFTRPAINRSPGAVFSEMVDAAKAFASRIKGEVIAPGYDDLSTDDIESIRRSIEKVASQMEEYGINPGSEEATRLFG